MLDMMNFCSTQPRRFVFVHMLDFDISDQLSADTPYVYD
jgi:hypothetical protein